MKTVRTVFRLFFLLNSIFSPLKTALSDIFLQPKIVTYKNILKKLMTSCIISTAAVGAYLYNKPHHHQEDFSDGKYWSSFGNAEHSYLLHLHGWMSHAHKRNNFIEEHFFIVSPRFEETLVKKLYRSYFGQEPDVLQALKTLKETKNHIKNNKIFVIAYSRGAAVFLTLISVLCQKNHSLLKKAGIDETQRLFLLNCFKHGRSVLISPLISMRAVLEYRFTKYFGGIFGHYVFLPLISGLRYNPRALTPLASLDFWENSKSIPIWIICPQNDTYIGNAYREKLIEKLEQKNGKQYTQIITVDSNKHLSKKFFEIAKYILLHQLDFI